MTDVELVIKIPKRVYNYIRKYEHIANSDISDIKDAIINGISLPKGHGDLIDADDLDITTITTDDYSGNEVLEVVLKEDIDNAPTIIEADKEANNADSN